jgi:quinol-cytochrome oxidoreductase complex cytochrome b subunit
MVLLLTVFCLSGCLLALVSVPLILHKIGPNPLYGFRVKKTLEDPAVWYPVNAYAAKRLLAVGVIDTLTAIGLFCVPDIDVSVYAICCGIVSVGGLLVALVQSFLYLRTFPDKAP